MSVSSIPTHVRRSGQEKDGQSGNQTFLERFSKRELADMKSVDLWRGSLAECLGSFMVVVITVSVGLGYPGGEPPLIQVALGCGFTLAFIITAFGRVSGGHVNPAISVGFLVTGEITFCRFVIYSIFQTIGGVIGAAFLREIIPEKLVGNLGLISPHLEATTAQALWAEAFITFVLLFVTMAMLDKGRRDMNGSIPFIVGLVVTVNILMSANISGGCMNPIRNFGPAVILGKMDKIWIYWAGPMGGGFLGAFVYDWFFSTLPMGPTRCRSRLYDTVQEDDDDKMNHNLRRSLEKSPESNIM